MLRIEVRHIRDEILDHGHVRKGINPEGPLHVIEALQAGQRVGAINVHCARAANALTAGAAKRQSRIDFVLDLNEGIENHRPTSRTINPVSIKPRIARLLGIPTVDLNLFPIAGSARPVPRLSLLHPRFSWQS